MRSREGSTATAGSTPRTPHLVYVFVVLLLVFNGGCVRTTGQQLPTRDELDFQLHRNHPEIFYDTKLLPDGAEVSSYVLKRTSSRSIYVPSFVSYSWPKQANKISNSKFLINYLYSPNEWQT